jgi:hypothetical protein
MTEFLVECYVSRTDGGAVARSVENAQLAAHQLSSEGTPVRCLRSIFVPEDETCFFLYEAASADVVREAVRRAALPFERVTQAIAQSSAEPR